MKNIKTDNITLICREVMQINQLGIALSDDIFDGHILVTPRDIQEINDQIDTVLTAIHDLKEAISDQLSITCTSDR